MSTPGSNLFREAIRAIRPQTIQYKAWLGRVQNSARQWVNTYADPVPMTASPQMVPRSKYVESGLDLQKVYLKVFASASLIDVGRDTASDQFIWGGFVWQIDSNNDWFLQDGWMSCLAIRQGKVPV